MVGQNLELSQPRRTWKLSSSSSTAWLEQRRSYSDWSPSTLRRLASGLMAAATEAGFLKGNERVREPKAMTADAASLLYLRRTLLVNQDRPELAEVLLSGTNV